MSLQVEELHNAFQAAGAKMVGYWVRVRELSLSYHKRELC